MMDTLQARNYFVGRLEHFLKRIEDIEDPAELESNFYAMSLLTTRAEDTFHNLHEKATGHAPSKV